jgi:23S rRNA pseudouridine2605 synthase
MWSRRSSKGFESYLPSKRLDPMTDLPQPPEPPLWEQWAAAGVDAAAELREDGERLQKVLAQRGYGSRRSCEELISAGRVRVNGEVAVLGDRIDPEVDLVEVDGRPAPVRAGLVYYLLNKPAGVVSTAKDTHGRPTVVDLVPDEPRVYPVGRLDAETEGLLLLTNDGELTNRLTHPRYGVEKEYLATVEPAPVSQGSLRRLRDGVELDDGMTAPARVSQPDPGLLRLTIHEGRNRQVRRMCEAVGHRVTRLVRVRIGPLSDRRLQPGEWRPLDPAEVRQLIDATPSEVVSPDVPKRGDLRSRSSRPSR